jgi:hypothetical protein
VAFYVPLGPRGVLLRLGTFLIGIWGGLVYRVNSWRRGAIVQSPEPFVLTCQTEAAERRLASGTGDF